MSNPGFVVDNKDNKVHFKSFHDTSKFEKCDQADHWDSYWIPTFDGVPGAEP